ncbi:hypothetical protein SCARR_04735 [Pontiella sulfatireligans]|uniref:SLA1 homology domain-containing protein n=2 Tax=Pontiella sulfatireligans TaxID=2750658 RepID=A0A6C2UQR9_9BACT|nr:hypothetical protein SCARR_04735 [Pontiella sulfatireligans]
MVLCVAFLVVAVQAENRIWTGKAGQTIEAEYVKDASGKVWLKPVSGKVKVVPIAALSAADQNYIYKQTLPKIEISVDDDIKRSTVGSDIDNVHEKIKFKIQVKKTSKAPYPVDYEIIFCALAEDIRYEELILADKKVETFSLKEKNDVYGFTGQQLHFEHDPDPAWGTKYDGYLVCVQTVEGVVLATKGRDKYIESINVLRDAKVRSRFDEKFNVSTRSSNRF